MYFLAVIVTDSASLLSDCMSAVISCMSVAVADSASVLSDCMSAVISCMSVWLTVLLF